MYERSADLTCSGARESSITVALAWICCLVIKPEQYTSEIVGPLNRSILLVVATLGRGWSCFGVVSEEAACGGTGAGAGACCAAGGWGAGWSSGCWGAGCCGAGGSGGGG